MQITTRILLVVRPSIWLARTIGCMLIPNAGRRYALKKFNLIKFKMIHFLLLLVLRVSPRKMRKHHGNWWFGFSAARVVWGPEVYPSGKKLYENLFIYTF